MTDETAKLIVDDYIETHTYSEVKHALQIASKALAKTNMRIPVKHTNTEFNWFSCPTCEAYLCTEKHKLKDEIRYCQHCGQKLCWALYV